MNRTLITTDIIQRIVNDYVNGLLGSSTISKKYNIKASTICGILRRNGVKIRSAREKSLKNTCDEQYFKVIDSEHKAYWLGFLLADGYVSVRNNSYILGLSLATKDYNHLVKFKTDIKATNNIKTYVSSGFSANPYCRIVISNPVIVQDLINHGVIEHKSSIMIPPNSVPDIFIKDCVRGYFDGNGCISLSQSNKQRKPIYGAKIVGTEEILEWIRDFSYSNGVKFSYSPYKRKSYQTVSQLDIGGNFQAQHFLDLLYNDATIYLDRKYERYLCLRKINTVVSI